MIQSILNNIAFIFASLISLGLLGSGVWGVWRISKRDSEILANDKKLLENQQKVFEEMDVFKKQLTKVCDIVGYQFQKNGGGSTTDKIDRIEVALNEISERQVIDFLLDDQPKYECDENGHCVRVNYAWRKLTGLSEEDALGNGWLKAIHQKNVVMVRNHWEDFIHNHIPFDVEYIFINPQTKKEILVKSRAIRKDDKGGLKIIIGTVEVIKEYSNERNKAMVS
jgi:PAS domain S-box-containing protein